MNYTRIYNQIIDNRLANPANGYTESHHIIPRSLGGLDESSNLVELTAREHFLCHWLLVKIHRLDIYNHAKMLRAFSMMCFCKSYVHQRVTNSRVFEKYRIEFAKMMSKSQIGDKNSQFGTMWICDIQNKINKKVTKGEVPEGWTIGRDKWNQRFITCAHCSAEVVKIKRSRFWSDICKTEYKKAAQKYKNGFSVSVDGIEYDSISHAADAIGIGHETARMRFKSKNFPEYVILSR
jgi:hypothetical protein